LSCASAGGLTPAESPPTPDRDLQLIEQLRGHLSGDRYVRVSRHRDFRCLKAGYLVPREPKVRRDHIAARSRRYCSSGAVPAYSDFYEKLTPLQTDRLRDKGWSRWISYSKDDSFARVAWSIGQDRRRTARMFTGTRMIAKIVRLRGHTTACGFHRVDTIGRSSPSVTVPQPYRAGQTGTGYAG
jgi:hypothetical protein